VTRRSIALVVGLALLWGASYPLIKVSVETIPPLTVAALRGLFGGALLFAFMGRDAPALWRSGVPLRTFVAQATLNCIIPWTFVAWASRIIDASLATVLNSLAPIFAFLITWGITRHEPATPRKFIGVMLGLAGVMTIIGIDALSGVGRHTMAELACLAGSLSYGIAAVAGTQFRKLSPLVPATGSTLVATVFMVPLALVFEQPWNVAPSMRSLLAVAGLVVFSTGIAFIVYFRLLSTIGTIGTTAQAYLRIVVGVGLGVAFLGERLSVNLVAGIALVIAGVVAMVGVKGSDPKTPVRGQTP
jgi:drug/metabolite transporter (DMT)-like permease